MIAYFINFIKTTVLILCFMMSYNVFAQQPVITPINSYAAELLEGRNLEEENDLSKKNLIQSQEMALQIAEIYAESFYGKNEVSHQKPYLIADNKTEWIICGQLPKKPIQRMGGTFLIVISKADGRVIVITHNR